MDYLPRRQKAAKEDFIGEKLNYMLIEYINKEMSKAVYETWVNGIRVSEEILQRN